MSDPFEQVLGDAREQTNRLIHYLDAGHEVDDEIRDILADVEETVRELDSSIAVMKQAGNLDDAIITNRESQMQGLKRDVALLKNRAAAHQPVEPDDAESLDASGSAGTPAHNLVQEQMIREQDQHLDTIHHTMQNLHLQASTMGNELEDQGMLLEDLDQGMDGVMGKLARGRRQLEWVYEKNKEKYNDCCIGLLIAVLLVLLVLAFIL